MRACVFVCVLQHINLIRLLRVSNFFSYSAVCINYVDEVNGNDDAKVNSK